MDNSKYDEFKALNPFFNIARSAPTAQSCMQPRDSQRGVMAGRVCSAGDKSALGD
jgi:hypothetical protein